MEGGRGGGGRGEGGREGGKERQEGREGERKDGLYIHMQQSNMLCD